MIQKFNLPTNIKDKTTSTTTVAWWDPSDVASSVNAKLSSLQNIVFHCKSFCLNTYNDLTCWCRRRYNQSWRWSCSQGLQHQDKLQTWHISQWTCHKNIYNCNFNHWQNSNIISMLDPDLSFLSVQFPLLLSLSHLASGKWLQIKGYK